MYALMLFYFSDKQKRPFYLKKTFSKTFPNFFKIMFLF